MRALRVRRGIAVTGVVVGIVIGAGAAMAASTIVTDTDNVHLRVVKNSFANGFVAGWHTHPGPVLVQVERGYFKVYQGSCAPKIVGPGETYIETPGVPAKVEAKGEIEWTTTFLYETGLPASTPAADPCS